MLSTRENGACGSILSTIGGHMPSRRPAYRRLSRANGIKPYDTYEVRNLAELMELAKEQKFEGFATIFRGQSEDFPLIPKIGRSRYPTKEVVQVRPGGLVSGWHTNPAESGPRWVERIMLEQFERMAPSFTTTLPQDRWEVLALAQHHGLPTRLLDWTYSPYVAAWFVVGRPPRPRQGPGVIWIHVPDDEDYVTSEERQASPLDLCRQECDRPLVFEPKFTTARIRAQDGLFTVQAFDAKQCKFLPINDYGSHRECMSKVLIPRSAFAEMAYELNYVGVNASALFPDLDGLARRISDDFTRW